jgi:hypothetical protein
MKDLEQIKKEVAENLKFYGYDAEIANNIIAVVSPGVVLVDINGRKMEMYL